MRILQNQVECKKCGDKPYSAHRHDFRHCKCGSIAVDGGMDYLRRVGDLDNYIEMSISVPKTVCMEMVEAIEWAEETGRNDLGIVCAIFRVLRDSGHALTPAEYKTESKFKKIFKKLYWKIK